MNKKPIITVEDSSKLAELRQDLLFMPNPAHRRAKSQFWARYADVSGRLPNLPEVLEVTREPGVSRWWSLPGFKEWFFNADEARERLEYLYMLALDSAEELLLNPNSNDNAKVQAIKIIANLAGKEPNKNENYLDAEIAKMDQNKLRAYIKRQTTKVLNAEQVDNTNKVIEGDTDVNGEG